MRQHAIPHNVLDVEFKIFEKLTIKQFVYIALGVGAAGLCVMLFSRNIIPLIVAAPLGVMTSGLGLFFGLVSLNDMPADKYLSSYLVAITRPTQRIWRNKEYDAKFEDIVKARNEILSEADTADDNGLSSNKVFGAASGIERNTAIHEATQDAVNAIDAEEARRMQEIDRVTDQFEATSAPLPAQTQPQADINSQTQPSAALTAADAAIQAETPIAQPKLNPISDEITIDATNIDQYSLPINFETIPSTLNLYISQQDLRPAPSTLVIVKDASGKPVLARQTDSNGYMITDKKLPEGSYTLEIKSDKLRFPTTKLQFESRQYPIINIKALNG